MTIKRTINGNEIEIELMDDEIEQAYRIRDLYYHTEDVSAELDERYYDNHCHVCGAEIENPNDMHIINDRVYCDKCCFYCDDCHEWHPIAEGRHSVTIDGVDYTVCNHVFITRIRTCDECGQLQWKSQKEEK